MTHTRVVLTPGGHTCCADTRRTHLHETDTGAVATQDGHNEVCEKRKAVTLSHSCDRVSSRQSPCLLSAGRWNQVDWNQGTILVAFWLCAITSWRSRTPLHVMSFAEHGLLWRRYAQGHRLPWYNVRSLRVLNEEIWMLLGYVLLVRMIVKNDEEWRL